MLTTSYNSLADLAFNDYFGDMNIAERDKALIGASSLLSEAIWEKFGFDTVMSSDEELYRDVHENHAISTAPSAPKTCEIRNHDCMWAGHCGSKEHPVDEPRLSLRTIFPPAPVISRTSTGINKPQAVTSGRSLLLRTAIRQQQTQQTAQQQQQIQHQSVVSPESPPMSDDEENKTVTLQMLEDVISSCNIEDDSDLCEYFEEKEFLSDSAEQSQSAAALAQSIRQYNNDHSYHKGKNASMDLNSLGIETPSDSEEEIDVVSVGDKHNTRGIASILPNNPTSVDRKQLQKTMATAISSIRLNSPGIKTILPFRKPSAEQSPVKRKGAPEGRMTTKRTKYQHRITPNYSPYKRRGAYHHSSDSEAEPLEKRSLHNNMERQRRIDLRNAFEDLRLLVPEVSKKERAAKVVILRAASIYCDALGDISDKMSRQKDDLKREQERLRSRLSQLRRALAAKHR